MTATADSSSSTSDPGGTRPGATPPVHEVRARADASLQTDHAPTGEEADARVVALVYAARRGDNVAWDQLIARFDPMLRRVARSFRLGASDVDDITQATWVLLYTHIGGLRDPAALAGWLATTARRQALRLLQAKARECLVDDPALGAVDHVTPEAIVLDAERRAGFMRAVRTLPDRQRRVVTLLAAQPNLDYQQLAALLQMPMGSIGPTRARGLARLERDEQLRDLCSVAVSRR